MKHTLKVTLVLILIFVASQVTGLLITKNYLDYEKTIETGNITWTKLPYDIERPEIEQETSFIWIILAILLGTGLVLLIAYFGRLNMWRFWFAVSVWLALSIAFNAFIPESFAVGIALILAIMKTYKPNIYIHNITEIFIYGGLAALIVPILNTWGAIILLILISIYDMIAVWKSKHMIKLAKFQTQAKVFAGALIPYHLPKKAKASTKGKLVKVKTAVLGGGDIGFPLIFSGVILKSLLFQNTMLVSVLKVLIITFTSAIALFVLFYKAEKNKFYPAMPFITIGCLIGYIIVNAL
ncbi:hypothetical protein KY330_01160 [Candidatus Woesearchaeota archaeon]|nr:hypothetical protein [Candidatus Woesearchaeota archaeon]